MASDYNPSTGIIQTAAHVAGRIHAGSGNQDAWAASFESILSVLLEEVEDVNSKSVASTTGSVSRSTGNATPTLATPPTSGDSSGFLPNGEKQSMWDFLWENPSTVFNNYGDSRSKSGGGKGPDFKFRNDCGNDTYKGEGLWTDSMPSAFRTAEGIVEFASKGQALDALRERVG
ncbi:MAG: hypothetical protein CL512_05205 [Actinobacteria bacterium]|nr:hypothetical protein [Actinomycetota bacterium]|tara:strand:- start:6657 stop:7178 length:522 start_codon:yes stop_codon:yes gene_type:complete